MDEYEYYDYNDEGDQDGDDWEVEVENLYVEGKAAIDSNTATARAKLQQVISLDQEHGRWTYKAKKMILRAIQTDRNIEGTIAALSELLKDSWKGRTSASLEKTIVKFLDRCVAMGFDVTATENILRVLIGFVTANRQANERLYFIAHIRLSTLELQARRCEGLLDRLLALLAEATSGENAEIRRGGLIVQLYWLLIITSELEENWDAFATYTDQALAMRHTIPPNRIVGVIREAEGRIAAEYEQWDRAREAFLAAFRAYDEAGDSKRFTTLCLLLASSILSTTTISPFQTNEGRSYVADPSLAVMIELFEAFTKNDAASVRRLLGDPRWAALVGEDRTVPRMHAHIVRRVQENAIVAQCRPYQCVKMNTIAKMAGVENVDDARPIVCQLIRRGKLHGRVNALEDNLILPRRQEDPRRGANDVAMEQWLEALENMHRTIVSSLPSTKF